MSRAPDPGEAERAVVLCPDGKLCVEQHGPVGAELGEVGRCAVADEHVAVGLQLGVSEREGERRRGVRVGAVDGRAHPCGIEGEYQATRLRLHLGRRTVVEQAD